MDGSIITIGLNEHVKKMERLQTTNPDMADMLNQEIARMLKGVRNRLTAQAAQGLRIKDDPRQMSRAVLYAVYKRIFGGNVNILNRRRAGAPHPWNPPRRIREGQWGGNRRARSARTTQVDDYFGLDRAFILRFLNYGTRERSIKEFTVDPHRPNIRRGLYGGKVSKYGKTVNTGKRGGLKRKDWFGPASTREMTKGAEELEKFINNIILKIIN